MNSDERAIATAVIRLMQGVVYQESEDFDDLRRHLGAVRDHFATIGIDVVVDENEGYSYLRTREPEEGEEPLPRLVRRRALTYPDSLLLVLLRKRMVEFEAAGDEGQLVVTRDEIVEMLRLFLAQSTDEARVLRQVDVSIGRLAGMGFLRQLRGQRDSWEVRRILKASVDGQTLSDFSAKLAEYASGGSDDE